MVHRENELMDRVSVLLRAVIESFSLLRMVDMQSLNSCRLAEAFFSWAGCSKSRNKNGDGIASEGFKFLRLKSCKKFK